MEKIGVKWSETPIIEEFTDKTMICVVDKYGNTPQNSLISVSKLINPITQTSGFNSASSASPLFSNNQNTIDYLEYSDDFINNEYNIVDGVSIKI